jgi:hypothetical protein
MEILAYLYNSETPTDAVDAVLDRLDDREEATERIDVATAQDPADARRDAMLKVGSATRVGPKPDGLFDDDGNPDFSVGVLITEEATGRRNLYVGEEALDVL